jgi:hypothetical protein
MTEQRDPRPRRVRDPPRSGGLEDVRHYGDGDEHEPDVAPPCSECGSEPREPESTTCSGCSTDGE